MTDDSKATLRPWRAAEELALDYRPHLVVTADGKSRIALMYSGGPIRAISKAEERANAALIVTAVNGYDALMAERDWLRQQVEDLEADASNDYGKYLALKHDYDRLRQVLKEAQCAGAQIIRVYEQYESACHAAIEELCLVLARIREALGDGDLGEEKK